VGSDLAVLDRRSLILAFFRDFEVRKDSRVDDLGFGIVLRAWPSWPSSICSTTGLLS
jgi:hypothetical protein